MSLRKENTLLSCCSEAQLFSKIRLLCGVRNQTSPLLNYPLFELVISLYKLLRSYHDLDNVYQGEESSLPISSLLNSEQYSDIRLSIEGSIIPAHKFVLGMKCKYFNDMFSSGMKESHVQVLEIPDVKLGTFQGIFLYEKMPFL